MYSPGNEENLHHWNIIECQPEFENSYLKNNDFPKEGECYSGEWLKVIEVCRKISLVWAVGGPAVIFYL